MKILPLVLLAMASCVPGPVLSSNDYFHGYPVIVRRTEDFEVSGDGSHPAWSKTEWTALRRRQEDGHPYDSRFKALSSQSGIYVLLDGNDTLLTTPGRHGIE